jgi:hypothetical protein
MGTGVRPAGKGGWARGASGAFDGLFEDFLHGQGVLLEL